MIRTVGIDFDNTLVRYDRLFARLAGECGFPSAGGKTATRDAIRDSAEGDLGWQKLQGMAYGPRMGEAEMMPGGDTFLRRCLDARVRVFIISHKTEKAGIDPTGTDLRQAARAWLVASGVLDTLGVSASDVYFEPTRAAKIARIAALNLPVFVDDLEEVLLDASFPGATRRVLFHPEGPVPAHLDLDVCRGWDEVADLVLKGRP